MTIIADTPREDRPREKLLRHGPECLTDSELLAIVLATSGRRGVSVLDIAKEMVYATGSLRKLAQKKIEELKKTKGIGASKAILIKAVFELAQRHERELPAEKQAFKAPVELARYFIPQFRGKEREIFMVLLFDSKHRLLRDEVVSVGTIMQALVEPREVFASAILMRAASVILMHNHPSGDPKASPQDRLLTEQIVAAGKILGIPVIDHIILGNDTFYSFRENNEIN